MASEEKETGQQKQQASAKHYSLEASQWYENGPWDTYKEPALWSVLLLSGR